MKLKSGLIALGLLVVSLVRTNSVASAQQFTPAPAPKPGDALVYVYPKKHNLTASASVADKIYINSDFLATLRDDSYAVRELPAGSISFTAIPQAVKASGVDALTDKQKAKYKKLTVNLAAGKTYYIMWHFGATGSKMEVMDEATALKALQPLKLAKD